MCRCASQRVSRWRPGMARWPRIAWRCGSAEVGGGQQEKGEGCLHGWRSPLPGVVRGRRTLPLHMYGHVPACRHSGSCARHVTHPDHDPPGRLSVAEEAAMIDLAAYVLEPLHQEGACLLARGQPQTHTATHLPALLVVAPVGDHPAPASLRRLEHEYALRAALDPAWAVRPLALTQHQG